MARAREPELLQALLLELPVMEAPRGEPTSTLRVRAAIGSALDEKALPYQEGAWGVRYHLEGPALHLRTEGGTTFRADTRAGSMEIRVPASQRFRLTAEVGAGMATALPFLLRSLGLQPLHAAAVRWTEGGREGVVLLPGLSGSGKSTTAGRLATHGFPLLSDDLALAEALPEPDAPLRILPYARPVRFRADALRRFPALSQVKLTASPPLPPVALLFPSVATEGPAEAPHLRPLSQTEALSRLMECSLLMGEPERMGRQLRCLGLLARLPAFRFPLGTTGPEPATLLRKLLSSATSNRSGN